MWLMIRDTTAGYQMQINMAELNLWNKNYFNIWEKDYWFVIVGKNSDGWRRLYTAKIPCVYFRLFFSAFI